MICPACAGEFVDGVVECPDCAVALVAPIEPGTEDPTPQADHWQTVWTVKSFSELSVVTSLLESSGIAVRAPGKTVFGLVFAYRDQQAAPNQIWPPLRKPEPVCEVQVPASRAEEALALLEAEPESID